MKKPKFKPGDIVTVKFNAYGSIESGEFYQVTKVYSENVIASNLMVRLKGKKYEYDGTDFRKATPIEILQYRMQNEID